MLVAPNGPNEYEALSTLVKEAEIYHFGHMRLAYGICFVLRVLSHCASCVDLGLGFRCPLCLAGRLGMLQDLEPVALRAEVAQRQELLGRCERVHMAIRNLWACWGDLGIQSPGLCQTSSAMGRAS